MNKHRTALPDRIRCVHKAHAERGTRPSWREYLKLLQEEVGCYSRIFLVIDALDECREVDGTRNTLLTELENLQRGLQLLVTSRPHISDIERVFRNSVNLEIRAQNEDVRKYLDGRLEREVRLKNHIEQDPALRDEIIRAIIAKVDGMYVRLSLID